MTPVSVCQTALDLHFRNNGRPYRALWKASVTLRETDQRPLRRSLVFHTDVAVTAPVMAALLHELGVDHSPPTPPTASSPASAPPSPASPSPAPPSTGVGRFFLRRPHGRLKRVTESLGPVRRQRWDERVEEGLSIPVHPSDVPNTFAAVLHDLEQTPFVSDHSTRFLVPTAVPLHFSCPSALRSNGYVVVKFKWRGMPIHGPRSLLEDEVYRTAMRQAGLSEVQSSTAQSDEEREDDGVVPDVQVHVRVQVVEGGGGVSGEKVKKAAAGEASGGVEPAGV